MQIEGVFEIPDRCPVVTGTIQSGIVRMGDKAAIVGSASLITCVIIGVEMFQKILDQGEEGDYCGILIRLENGTKDDIPIGSWICHTHNMV